MEGLAASGTLAEAAIERAIRALKTCADSLKKAEARRVRSIATEPCRRAGNAAAFVRRVASETGLMLESVSPADEAGLTLAGCRPPGFCYYAARGWMVCSSASMWRRRSMRS